MLVLWISIFYIRHALFSLNNYIGSNHIYKLFISGPVNKSLVPMVVKPFLFISMIFYLYSTKWQKPLPQGAVFKQFLWLCIFCVPVKYIFRFSFAGRELGTWLWYWWGAQNVSDDVRKRLREGQLYPACFAPSISAVLINSERLWKERERGGTLRVGIVFTKLGEPGMGRERLKEWWQEMSGNDG